MPHLPESHDNKQKSAETKRIKTKQKMYHTPHKTAK